MKRRQFLQGTLSLGAAGLLPGVGLAKGLLDNTSQVTTGNFNNYMG